MIWIRLLLRQGPSQSAFRSETGPLKFMRSRLHLDRSPRKELTLEDSFWCKYAAARSFTSPSARRSIERLKSLTSVEAASIPVSAMLIENVGVSYVRVYDILNSLAFWLMPAMEDEKTNLRLKLSWRLKLLTIEHKMKSVLEPVKTELRWKRWEERFSFSTRWRQVSETRKVLEL